MRAQRFPVVTLAVLLATTGLYWFVPDRTLLYFSAEDIARGEFWRLVTGHFSHADPGHLLWNCLGLTVLGVLIERRSVAFLLISLGTGIVMVSTLLLSPFSQLVYYCGLSGALNSLLVVALWLEWKASRSYWVAVVAFVSVLKVVVEIILGTSIVTNISWPPYAWSHAAGLLGGLLLVSANSALGRLPPLVGATSVVPLGSTFRKSDQIGRSNRRAARSSH
jgi:rhomboid family GlyGly-CTERM serine protease